MLIILLKISILSTIDKQSSGARRTLLWTALKTIAEDESKFATVETLLQALLNHETASPERCKEWTTLEELEECLKALLEEATEINQAPAPSQN